jgi:pimeloyl-ACP methyl ester carboxylesterase
MQLRKSHANNPSQLWLNTPDNRPGWASHFITLGYQLYILDPISTGRSTQNDITNFPLRLGSTTENVEAGFTAPETNHAYPYPQSVNHTQWPDGNGTHGNPIFDAFMASINPLTSNTSKQELAMRAAGCELLSLIGEAYLIAHSAGATYSILLSDECPDKVRGSINLEPGNIPFQSYVSTIYDANSTTPPSSIPARPWGLTVTPLSYDPPDGFLLGAENCGCGAGYAGKSNLCCAAECECA